MFTDVLIDSEFEILSLRFKFGSLSNCQSSLEFSNPAASDFVNLRSTGAIRRLQQSKFAVGQILGNHDFEVLQGSRVVRVNALAITRAHAKPHPGHSKFRRCAERMGVISGTHKVHFFIDFIDFCV